MAEDFGEESAPRITAEATRDLLSYINEFLGFHDFPQTVASLVAERALHRQRSAVAKSIGGQPGCLAGVAGKDYRSKLRQDMLRYFDEGKRDAFFTAWQQFVPASAVSFDLLTLKLEFYLSVYFSVYPVLPSSSVLVAAHRRDAGGGAGGAGSAGEAGRAELATRMRVLKTFLETRGAGLAHTGEFLAYYALPYVPNPEHHPSFEHLFTDSWVANQRQAMRLYLESMPDGSETPTLYSMFDSWQTATDATTRLSPRALSTRDGVRTPGRGANPKPAPGRIATGFSSMLRQQAAGSGARAVAMLAKSKNAASGGTANGHHVLGGVGGSILDSRQQPQHQQGGGRPAWPGIERGGDDDGCGGAHARTRSSLSLAGTTSLSEELDLMDDVLQSTVNLPEATARAMAAMASMALADEAAAAVLEASGGSSSRPSGAPPPLTAEDSLMATPAPRMIAPLSYDMVVDSVVVGAQERGPAGALAASLLQALRWRLVHSTQRRQVLSTWVEADLLRVNAPQHEQVLHIASHSSEAHVLEEVARLANGIASDRLGRTYLLSTGSSAVASLVRMAQRSAASRFEAAAANGVHQRTWSAGGGQRLAHAHGGGTATPAPPALSRADSFKRPSPSYTRRLPGRSGGGSRDPNDAAFFDAAPQASSSNQHRRAAWPLAPLASKSQTLRGASPDGAAVPPYAANRRATEPVISTMFDARASGGSHCSGSGGSALRSGVSSMAGGVGCSSEHGSRVPTPPLAGGGADGGVPSVGEGERDGALLQQSLVALQKLSLRRKAQSSMLSAGLLPWLVAFLASDVASLSEFTLEYGCALLMNLCLRSAGKAAAAGCAAPLLALIEALLEHRNDQVRTYVHGMLYSVLGNAFVRQLARERGLPAALDAVAAGAPPLFASQIKVILTQLEDCAHDDPTTFADAASDDEDGPEGDSNYDDDDAFVDVEMAPEAWEPELGSLQGEPLLCECYLANSVDARQWADRARRSRASFDGPRLTDGPHMVCDSSDLGTTIGSLAPGDPTWASTVAAAVNSGHPGDSMRARRSLASFDGPRLTDGPHMVCDSSELGTTIGSLAPGDPTWVATVACTAAAADGHPLTSVGAADNVRESWAGAGSGSGELEEDGGGDVDDDNDGVAASLRGLPPVPEEAQHSPSPSSNNSRIPALALSPPQLLLTGEPGSADAAAAALMTVATTPSRMNTALRASMASLGHDGGGGALSRTAGQSEELLSAEELLPQSSTAAVAQQHTSRTAAMQPVAVPQQQPSSPPHPPAKDTPASAPPAPPPPPLASSVSLSSDRAGGPLSLGLRPASGRDPASPALSRNSPAGPARVRTPPQQQQQQQQPSSRPPDATAPLAVTPHQAQLCVTAGGHSEKPAAESFSRGASPLHAISSNPPPPASSHGGSPGAPDGTDRSNSHFNNHGSGNSHSDNHSTSHDNGNNEISSSNEHFYGSTGRDSADGHPPSASNQHHDGSSPPPTTPDGAPTAGAGRDGSDGDESYADGRPLLTLSQLPHVDTHSPPPASGAAAPPGSGSRIPSRPASSERTGRQRMVSSPTHSPAF